MLVKNYASFVEKSNQNRDLNAVVRNSIETYGLVSEIGSLLSVIKKEKIGEAGLDSTAVATEELQEEIGDVFWYCFSLLELAGKSETVNFLVENIQFLRNEISGETQQNSLFKSAISPLRITEFLEGAQEVEGLGEMLTFDDYQRVAYLTARTESAELKGVCLSVMWQLGAELMTSLLPESEKEVKYSTAERPYHQVIGDIAWHLSAVASIYGLSLNRVVEANVEKISFRLNREERTEQHDAAAPENQRFPDQLEVSILTVGEGRSRMYVNGKQLGDDLTDNSYEADGYRFHDVLHLSNAVYLGWSPVLRRLLGAKRKYSPEIDEVEDGARASIVEEAIVKIIHSEGTRIAHARQPGSSMEQLRIFEKPEEITFGFLKFLRSLVVGLEVHQNKYWEWEDSIVKAYEIYFELCQHQQGTVLLNFKDRNLNFVPTLFVDITGTVACFGSAAVGLDEVQSANWDPCQKLTKQEIQRLASVNPQNIQAARLLAAKRAILSALCFADFTDQNYREIEVIDSDNGRITFNAAGCVRRAMWSKGIITFKSSATSYESYAICSVIGIADPNVQSP